MNVIQVLELLKSTSSRNAKLVILKDNINNELLKTVFDYTYNSDYVLGIREIDCVECFLPYSDETSDMMTQRVIDLVQQLINGEFKPNSTEMRAHITTYALAYLSQEHFNLLQRIISRDLLVGVSTAFRKAWGIEKAHQVSLCDVLNEKTVKKIKFPCFLQLKYDAARTYHKLTDPKSDDVLVESFSRNNKELKFSKEIQDELKLLTRGFVNDVYVDCESIYVCDDVDRKKSNGFFNKVVRDTATDDERNNFNFVVWDMYVDNDTRPYYERLATLREEFSKHDFKHITLAESLVVDSLDDAMMIAKNYMKSGYEGAILKNFDWIWCGKRTKEQLKIKSEIECELKIVGLVEGKNSRSGRLGAFQCESACGQLVVNVAGLTESEQNEYWTDSVIGSIITVRFNELIVDKKTLVHSLFLPRFVEMRLDKDDADTLHDIRVLALLS